MVCCIDGMKQINDVRGHRAGDVSGRVGGDEYHDMYWEKRHDDSRSQRDRIGHRSARRGRCRPWFGTTAPRPDEFHRIGFGLKHREPMVFVGRPSDMDIERGDIEFRAGLRLGVLSVGLVLLAGCAVATKTTIAAGGGQVATSAIPLASAHPSAPTPSHCSTPQCDAAARAARAGEFPPASTTLAPRATWVTRAQAIERAKWRATTVSGQQLDAAAARVLPATAVQMSYGQFNESTGQSGDVAISRTRMVWVVTVSGNTPEDVPPGRASVMAHQYTEVIDVASGTLIEEDLRP